MKFLLMPKHQQDKMIQKVFKKVFDKQLEGMESSLEKLAKIEKDMKHLTERM
jgi:hypothetical protein